jgi:hypothetical protein
VQTNLSQVVSCRTAKPLAGQLDWKRELGDVRFAFPLREFAQTFSKAVALIGP